jgi:hypothetical protein
VIDSQITVLIPTSITPSCPSTFLIDQAVRTVRYHLPEAKISICCDGLRDDVDRGTMTKYSGYCAELMGKYDNAKVTVFMEPVNQVGMLEYWLKTVNTPLVLYLEHDFEVLPDPIEWDSIAEKILDHTYNYIKLSGMHRIPPEHEHLMTARKRYGPGDHTDFCVIETIQMSTWPHIASRDWYQRMYDKYLVGHKGEMIEPILYQVFAHGWDNGRLAIYNPTAGAMARVQHWDGARWKPNV